MGCAVMCGAPCGPRNGVLDGVGACGSSHDGLWWSSLRGHEILCSVVETHAAAASWWLRWSSRLSMQRMWTLPLGPIGGA
eukprot:6562766-Pyramimonas_sp.AAC.1